jgi:hypothetical protein
MGDLFVGPVAFIIQVVLSVLLVVVVGICVFVAHPRLWWMNRSFDVEGYVEDELTPLLKANVATIVGTRATALGKRKSAVVSVGNDSIVRVSPGPTEADAVSMKGFVQASLPTAARVKLEDAIDAEHVKKYLVDMADEASARNSNKGNAVGSLIVECWSMNGTPVPDYVAAQGLLPVLFSIDKDALAGIRGELANPELAAAIRKTKVPEGDPAAALLLACVQAPSDDEAWKLMRSELDRFLECVAAISSLRKLTTFVFPQIKRMRLDRKPDMGFMEVYKMFNRPYLVQFKTNCSAAFAEFKTTKDAIWLTAKRMTDGFKKSVKSNITGKTETFVANDDKETFETQEGGHGGEACPPTRYTRDTRFGVRVDDDLRETLVEETFVEEFGGLGEITKVFKLLPNILKMVVELFKILIVVLKAFFELFKVLVKDPLMFIVKLILLVVNALILVILIVCAPMITFWVWVFIAVTPLAIKLTFYTILFSWACVWNFVLALGDVMTGGQLRFLALSEEHPESWWTVAGGHSGNRTSRVFGTFYPCMEGYSCGFVPVYCGKVSRCEPLRSPIATLAHFEKYGRPAPLVSTGKAFMHPLVPDEGIACIRLAERYKAQSKAPVTCNSFTLRADVREDIALAACMGRMKSSDAVKMCKVCESAVTGPHRAMASASNMSADMAAKTLTASATRGSTKAVFSVVALVALVAVSARVSVLRGIAAAK